MIAIADKAQQRLCRRFRRLAEQHKPARKIAVAIARELASCGRHFSRDPLRQSNGLMCDERAEYVERDHDAGH